jgi:hypothetical protein
MTRRPYFTAALGWTAGILILASGCMDQSPTAPAEQTTFQASLAPLGQGVHSGAVLALSTESATDLTAGTYSQKITPAGGTIDFGVGSLTFPKGAVQHTTTITAEINGASLAVQFGPHGLQFPADAQPELCFDVAGLDLLSAAILYVNEGTVLENWGGALNADSGAFCVGAPHFSTMILASD